MPAAVGGLAGIRCGTAAAAASSVASSADTSLLLRGDVLLVAGVARLMKDSPDVTGMSGGGGCDGVVERGIHTPTGGVYCTAGTGTYCAGVPIWLARATI